MTDAKGRRLPERVKEVLAQLIPKLKDPRSGFVTVTDVRLSRDNEQATVYWTVLPDTPEERERTQQGLESATPLLRRELGAALHVRKVPTITFAYDEVPEQGRRIEELLARTRQAQEPDEG